MSCGTGQPRNKTMMVGRESKVDHRGRRLRSFPKYQKSLTRVWDPTNEATVVEYKLGQYHTSDRRRRCFCGTIDNFSEILETVGVTEAHDIILSWKASTVIRDLPQYASVFADWTRNAGVDQMGYVPQSHLWRGPKNSTILGSA